MKRVAALAGLLGAAALALPALAQEVPEAVDQVAQPGGDLPGDPQIQLVKVADGFNDPISVANAGDEGRNAGR